MRYSMPRFFGHWFLIAAAFGAIILAFWFYPAPAPAGLAAPQAPADVCPIVPNTPNYTLAAGAVWLDGIEAAAGTIVSALSPRGDVVGCTEVSEAGHYGAMYVYGEDATGIPGMRDGETVSFRVNGLIATAAPELIWHNDWGTTHAITLTAWTPTPTPTLTLTPTPTNTPTIANQPDLVVLSMSVNPATPIADQPFDIIVVVKNQGSADVSDIFFTGLYVDRAPSGAPDMDAWLLSLAAGASDTLTFSRSLAAGSHALGCLADWDNAIVESNESNNKRTIAVQVAAAVTPTPTATPLPPVAPAVTISRSGNNAILTWTHSARNASYQVWRGGNPYFAPGAGAVLIGDGATGICSNAGGAITCTDTGRLGNPAANVFYLVCAFNAAGAQADSNRVGGFAFALQPGSP